jgi:AcrR family transcriptional regulator
MKQRPFHHGNLRQALIDATLHVLDTKGVAETSLRAISAQAGVSHAAPANHFRDRQTLLTEVANLEFSHIRSAIQKRLARRTRAGADRVLFFPETLLEYAMEFPNRYELLWRSDLVNHQDPDLLVVMDAIYDALCNEILQVAENKEFDVHTFAVSVWSMTHGYIALRLSGMFQELKDEVRNEPRFQAMMALLSQSIRKR